MCFIQQSDWFYELCDDYNLVAHQVIESLICTPANPPLEQTLQPPFFRFTPPLHKSESEFLWMNPTDRNYNIEWDEMMCSENSIEIEVRQLMAKALKGALSLPQQQVS